MAQIMGSVNNVQLLPEREGPAKNGTEPLVSISIETVSLLCRIPEGAGVRVLGDGKNGYKPVEVDGLPRSGQMVVADFRASMKKGKRPVRWMAGWRPIGFDMLEAA
jgi:hypothetical protein